MKKYRFLIIFLIVTPIFFLFNVLSEPDILSIANLITSAILGLVLASILHFSYAKWG